MCADSTARGTHRQPEPSYDVEEHKNGLRDPNSKVAAALKDKVFLSDRIAYTCWDKGAEMPQKKGSIADPTKLMAFEDKKSQIIQVVIETPRGSRNKYSFDPDQRVFALKKVLPEGMVFPYDFGFIPSTRGDDGDPIDVLILMDEAAFPGCVVHARLIGVIEGEQSEKGNTERNDRLLAVAETSHTHSDLKSIKDLNSSLLRELEKFFENYHADDGQKFKVLACKGPAAAVKCLERGRRKAA